MEKEVKFLEPKDLFLIILLSTIFWIIIVAFNLNCNNPSSVMDNGIIIEIENRKNSGKEIKVFSDLQFVTYLYQGHTDEVLVEEGSKLLAKIYDANNLTEKKIIASKNLFWSLP